MTLADLNSYYDVIVFQGSSENSWCFYHRLSWTDAAAYQRTFQVIILSFILVLWYLLYLLLYTFFVGCGILSSIFYYITIVSYYFTLVHYVYGYNIFLLQLASYVPTINPRVGYINNKKRIIYIDMYHQTQIWI